METEKMVSGRAISSYEGQNKEVRKQTSERTAVRARSVCLYAVKHHTILQKM
jgi:hypothetical protein